MEFRELYYSVQIWIIWRFGMIIHKTMTIMLHAREWRVLDWMRELAFWSVFSFSLAHASLPGAISIHTRSWDVEHRLKDEDALETYPLFQVNLFCRKAVQRLLSKSSVRSLTFFTVLTCFSGSACSMKKYCEANVQGAVFTSLCQSHSARQCQPEE